jgi:seryl-tRNA synthetase
MQVRQDEEIPVAQAPVGTPADGVYLWPESYERIVAALRSAVDASADPCARPSLTVPPVIARTVVERAGYVRSFPHLLGTVHSFRGSRRDWQPLANLIGNGDWYRDQAVTDVVLLPAACYPVYPLLAGTLIEGKRQFCVHATCFRQEASAEPGRLRSFRMSELVYAGDSADCLRWRDGWRDRLTRWLAGLGLAVQVEIADDPFFGPGDRLLRDTQRDQRLKWELQVPLGGGVVQAVASCNYHLDHFGVAFEVTAGDGPAHSACVAFGLDRITLALTDRYGPDPERWPAELRARLAMGIPA